MSRVTDVTVVPWKGERDATSCCHALGMADNISIRQKKLLTCSTGTLLYSGRTSSDDCCQPMIYYLLSCLDTCFRHWSHWGIPQSILGHSILFPFSGTMVLFVTQDVFLKSLFNSHRQRHETYTMHNTILSDVYYYIQMYLHTYSILT